MGVGQWHPEGPWVRRCCGVRRARAERTFLPALSSLHALPAYPLILQALLTHPLGPLTGTVHRGTLHSPAAGPELWRLSLCSVACMDFLARDLHGSVAYEGMSPVGPWDMY